MRAQRWLRSTRTATSSTTAHSTFSKDADSRDDELIRLVDGEPIVFGAEGQHAVVRNAHGGLKIVPTDSVDASEIVTHDAHSSDTTTAFALTRLSDPETLHPRRSVCCATLSAQATTA